MNLPWITSKRVFESLKTITGDKAAKAIEGLLLYPWVGVPDKTIYPDPPHLPPDQTVLAVTAEEQMIQDTLDEKHDIVFALDYVLTGLRVQVKTLALAYTKLQSDMNALRMQRANDDGFVLSMGDAYKFSTFLRENFQQAIAAHPELKTLDIAELVMKKLKDGHA
jgi:hypothetical protein